MREKRGSSGPAIRATQRRTSAPSIGAAAASIASMSTQSLGRSNTTLHTTRCSAPSTGIEVRRERHHAGGVAHRIVERVVAEEEVDRVPVPPEPDLTVAFEHVDGRVAGDTERTQPIDHLDRIRGGDEHVQVDVDRGARFRVVRQREGAAERVRHLGEGAVDRDDLLGQRRHVETRRGKPIVAARFR